MRAILKFQCIVIFLVLIQINIYAKKATNVVKKQDAIFTCQLSGRVPMRNYKVFIVFSRDFIAMPLLGEASYTHSIYSHFTPDSNGNFSFKLDSIDHPGLLSITIVTDSFYIAIGWGYWVEPGDNIKIHFVDQGNDFSAAFDGNNSNKYTCAYLLNKDYYDNMNSYIPKDIDRQKDGEELFILKELSSWEKYKNDKYHQLEKFRHFINPEVYFLMKTEINSVVNRNYLISLLEYLRSSGDSKKDRDVKNSLLYRMYQEHPVIIDTSNLSLLFLSNSWVESALDKIVVDFMSKTQQFPGYQEMFQEIKKNYPGKIHEKLFAKLLLDPTMSAQFRTHDLVQDNQEIMKYTDSALALTRTEYVKQYLEQQLSALAKGKPAYNIKLISLNNDSVSLSDFKGKTVLLDAWYVGCTGCAVFYKYYMDSLASYFENDTSFAFISVGIDSSRSQWLKGIESGKYTNKNHINLNGGVMGVDDDFMKYYHVTAFPYILLIDKNGKIFQKIRFGNWNDDTEELKKMIQQAMKE